MTKTKSIDLTPLVDVMPPRGVKALLEVHRLDDDTWSVSMIREGDVVGELIVEADLDAIKAAAAETLDADDWWDAKGQPIHGDADEAYCVLHRDDFPEGEPTRGDHMTMIRDD